MLTVLCFEDEAKERLPYLKTQFVLCSKHFSVIKTNQFMLYGAKVVVLR
jgi:hypothetical protein